MGRASSGSETWKYFSNLAKEILNPCNIPRDARVTFLTEFVKKEHFFRPVDYVESFVRYGSTQNRSTSVVSRWAYQPAPPAARFGALFPQVSSDAGVWLGKATGRSTSRPRYPLSQPSIHQPTPYLPLPPVFHQLRILHPQWLAEHFCWRHRLNLCRSSHCNIQHNAQYSWNTEGK